ncbi:MAG: hypothetical protein COV74_03770 [Candidatus Omnitrophica bacterium CG11_big_fil_rev_8_21_14_0_20_45_26]|uniref:Uncharacterized protein n=1 Tax=Candidatus Abzuiibacterium crystallinum TaxID=1974748 RepID=A0A2H0LQR0_9BACT|nr:MAG: hypothetical protein COV74_03770 [Candidatus Omnitrophica bacterium CG11_big_fil_rev_8_21_14_0_20_45_26]PIW64375.1 MAG: hypothetical protein COW12_06365 [Candidatus Omnitrophica bacterium CG12_big_fil_rev_8_21_14_0_65_45_16]
MHAKFEAIALAVIARRLKADGAISIRRLPFDRLRAILSEVEGLLRDFVPRNDNDGQGINRLKFCVRPKS